MADSVLRRYLRCLINGQPSGTGVPDGDGRLSIVRNYTFVNTFSPDSGRIMFDIIATPDGVLCLHNAATTATYQYGLNNTTSGGISISSGAATKGFISNPLVPNTYLANLPTSDSPAGYRIVNAMHSLRFTGSALNNGGSVTITPCTQQTTPTTIATSGNPRPGFHCKSTPTVAINPSSIIGSARDNYTVMILPRDTSYATIGDFVVTDVGSAGVGVPLAVGASSVGWVSHPSCKIYRVEYRGLDSTASITIESRVCVQYLVDPNGTETSFAKPSEMANQATLSNLLAAIGSSPMVAKGVDVAKHLVVSAIRQRYPPLLALTDL